MMPLTVNLIGPSPWGFRVSGGKDFKKALIVSKVSGGSKAELTGLRVGDVILEINGESTSEMLNSEAQSTIRSCRTLLRLLVTRPGPPRPGCTGGCTEEQEALFASQDSSVEPISSRISFPEPPVNPKGIMGAHTPANAKRLCCIQPQTFNHGLARPAAQLKLRQMVSVRRTSRTALMNWRRPRRQPLISVMIGALAFLTGGVL